MEPTASRLRPFSRRHGSRALRLAGIVAVSLHAPTHAAAPQQQPPTVPQIFIGGAGARLALPDCVARRGDDASREACRTLSQVLRNDLKFEGLFQFVSESLFSAIPPLTPEAPNFKDWEGIGATHLVLMRAQVNGSDLGVEVKVYYVPTGQTMLAKSYSGKGDNPRVFAHQASDDIVALTQNRGVARTKIAFTSDRDATKGKPSKELYIMDYDGYNPRRVTVNASLNILPAWSPDGRSLAYVSYRLGSPDVFLAWIYEGRSQNVTNGAGKGVQALSPAWSPDGKRIAYASNRGGNMDIWACNADGTAPRRLTSSAALDTAPAWSPTGQEIAFTSDRGGSSQIWLMDAEGLNVRRLTSVGIQNDSAAWNPSKEWAEIAYTSRLEAGGFEIAVIDLATRQVRQITEGQGSCEYPAWSPNGRHLAFACRRGGGPWQITVADRTGRSVTTLPAGPGNNVYPDWSPSPK